MHIGDYPLRQSAWSRACQDTSNAMRRTRFKFVELSSTATNTLVAAMVMSNSLSEFNNAVQTAVATVVIFGGGLMVIVTLLLDIY